MSDPLIPLARPALGPAEAAAVERVLASGRLVQGPRAADFEQRLANCTGRAAAVAVSSGTAALELALWALDIGAGDEVLVPAFGFPAAAWAVLRRGARAVPVDVSPDSWNLDVARAAAAVSQRTRALISIDQFGLVAEAAALGQFADAHRLLVIEDAACALGGADSAGVPGGASGVLATLSFHPRKIVTTGEGGAVLCSDAELEARLRALRNLGQRGPGEFAEAGTNARMSELAAAVGLVQMERLSALVAERRLLANGYRERLATLRDSGEISFQEPLYGAMHSYQTFAALLPGSPSREAVRAHLAERGIESGPATYAVHRVGVALGGAGEGAGRLPVADALHERALALPLYPGMRSQELDRVASALAEALA